MNPPGRPEGGNGLHLHRVLAMLEMLATPMRTHQIADRLRVTRRTVMRDLDVLRAMRLIASTEDGWHTATHRFVPVVADGTARVA